VPILIHPLTDGYVLETDSGQFAYTTISALAKGVKDYLAGQADRGKLVEFPRQSSAAEVQQVQQALAAASAVPPSPAAPPSIMAGAIQSTLDPLDAAQRQNFIKLCQDWASGQLKDKTQWATLLQTYVPGLDPHAAELIRAEFVADYRSDQ
jgi:hypothetical protein